MSDVAQFSRADERAHPTAAVEEWTASCWLPDCSLGLVTGLRLVSASNAWYWWAVVRRGRPTLHVVETSIPRRSDPLLAKSDAMWAEFICEDPFNQWTIGNETYAVGLDDPVEGLGRAYGTPEPVASDLEWYASSPVSPITDGYEQRGVVHGGIETLDGTITLTELPAHRTHRWGESAQDWKPAGVFAHNGLWVGFRFPDDSTLQLALTADGWRSRPSAR